MLSGDDTAQPESGMIELTTHPTQLAQRPEIEQHGKDTSEPLNKDSQRVHVGETDEEKILQTVGENISESRPWPREESADRPAVSGDSPFSHLWCSRLAPVDR